MKINVNGRELDYDEAICFIEEEKAKAVLSEKEQKLNEIVKKNLVVAKVKDLQSGMKHFVLCFALESMKYDYAMGAIEKHFGPKYYVGEKQAFKRYKTCTIDSPEEGLISLAKKVYREEHSRKVELPYTSDKYEGAIPVIIFDYMPKDDDFQKLTRRLADDPELRLLLRLMTLD